MSRQDWIKMSRSLKTGDDWRTALRPKPKLEGRTSDPRALDYDEASQLFFQGLRLARLDGDLEAGKRQIAAAFLLEGRSITFTMRLPDPEAGLFAIDYELLRKMIDNDDSVAAIVLRLMIARYLGHTSEGQSLIAAAMSAIEYLLNLIDQNPKLETNWSEGGILGGCLTRKRILLERSGLHMALGNHKKAIRDLTKALEIDPGYTTARDARASLWASLELKERHEIYSEYKRIISEVHQTDDRGLEVAYAWLAISTLEDGRLGTVEEARQYYEKSLRATVRRDELYGKRDPSEHPPVVTLAKQKFEEFSALPPEMRRLREQIDTAVLSGQTDNLQMPSTAVAVLLPKSDATEALHKCLKCGKTAFDIGKKLSKCGRCSKVSYCSKDCQLADWKSHKVFCKQTAAMPKKPPAKKPTQAALKVEKERKAPPAKTPISETDGCARSVARMEAELKRLYSEYGQGFSNWWHNMTVPQREELLLDMTVQTLPKTAPGPQEMHAGMQAGQAWHAAALDCNVKCMVGQCGCRNESHGVECPHYFPDRLLHELYIRAEKPETGYAWERELCVAMKKAGIFPDRHLDQLAFAVPSRSEGPDKHDMKFMVLTDACPEDKRKEWEDRIENGMVMDASVAYYLMERRQYTMMLLVVLFDEYQLRIRRSIPENPLERLRGCAYCHQSCEADTALRCAVCEVSWWCSPGCKNSCDHGKQCPYGRPSAARVLFS